jgi:hypothetical protein
VKLDQLLHDGEPKAEPAMATRSGAVGLAKAIEDVGQRLRRDAVAGVAHLDLVLPRPIGVHAHADSSAGGREFQRVREQVPQHLLQSRRIAAHDGGALLLELEVERDTLRVGRGSLRTDAERDELGEVDGLHVERDFASDDTAHVDEVGDELRLGHRVFR